MSLHRDDWAHGDDLDHDLDLDPPEPPAPGRRTLTAQIMRSSAPPDAAAAAPWQGPMLDYQAPVWTDLTGAGAAGQVAATGVAGASSALPHLDRIAAAFGHHDVSAVRVASDDAAMSASRALGATAYAFGDSIAAAGTLDLHTAAHEAAHVVQQRAGISLPGGMSAPGDASEREADAVADAVVSGRSAQPLLDAIRDRGGGGGTAAIQREVSGTSALHPEACPTYEMWLAQFRELPAFTAQDGEDRHDPTQHGVGQAVLGEAAPRDGSVRGRDPSPAAVHGTAHPTAGDRFIDHPTDAWVRANLPTELHDTAYQLPTDCADIAAVLRHVWLNAHGRTEQHQLRVARGRRRQITLGAGLGRTTGARRARIQGQIAGGRTSSGISSASADDMVQTYRHADGTPIFDWASIAQRLHPGDMIVWEHRYVEGDRPYGGHVQTVQSVQRGPDGVATGLRTIAGNQPLGLDDAEDIRDHHRDEAARPGMDVSSLRNAPGRRLERQQPPTADVSAGSVSGRWGWTHPGRDGVRPGYTVVIAVGPPAAAAAPRRAGAAVNVADWLPRLSGARTADVLQATLEAALGESRASIEGGDTLSATDLRALGHAAAAAARRLVPADGGAALRATMAEVVESFAAAAGSTEDRALHGGGPGGANTRSRRVQLVRDAFAPIREELTSSATTSTTAPTSTGTEVIQRQPRTGAATAASSLAAWPARLDAAANQRDLDAVFGQAIAAVVQAGATGAVDTAELDAIGHHAGERLWAFARAGAAAGDRGSSHSDPLYLMRAAIQARRAGATPAALTALTALDDAFHMAARGITTVDWNRSAPAHRPELQGARVRRVLLTGFDPFTGGTTAPTAADWNPSGAAVLRLDGSQLAVGGDLVAVEGVVYPVSFEQFGRGIVERVVDAQAGQADAVITVSMDPNLPGSAPVRVEQYAVGVHHVRELAPHPTRREPMADEYVRIQGAPSSVGATGRGADRPVIDAGDRTDVAGIAGEAGATVGNDLVLRFRGPTFARAQRVLGREAEVANPATYGPDALRVTDDARAAAIVAQTGGDFAAASAAPTVHFQVGTERFDADLLAGPGGNFLSNEVAYRTQRRIREQGGGATSFHVHTQGSTADLGLLMSTLQRLITSVITRRQAAEPQR